jgi:hypothetical protein
MQKRLFIAQTMGTLLKVSIWILANYMAPILGAKVDNIVSMDVDLTFGVIEDPYCGLCLTNNKGENSPLFVWE